MSDHDENSGDGKIVFKKRKIRNNIRKALDEECETTELLSNDESQDGEQKLIDWSTLDGYRELKRAKKKAQNGINVLDLMNDNNKKVDKEKKTEKRDGGLTDSKTLANELDLGNTFSLETNRRDEDAELMKYVEEELAKRRANANAKEASETNLSHRSNINDDLLIRVIPEHLLNITSETKAKNEEMLSSQMLSGIPEVDLGIDERIRNIERTEAARTKLMEEKLIQEKRMSDGGTPEISLVPKNLSSCFVRNNHIMQQALASSNKCTNHRFSLNTVPLENKELFDHFSRERMGKMGQNKYQQQQQPKQQYDIEPVVVIGAEPQKVRLPNRSTKINAFLSRRFTCIHNFQLCQNKIKANENENLKLEQYLNQIKPKLTNIEINQQRPSDLRFVEYENLFAFNVIKNSKEYDETIGNVLRVNTMNESVMEIIGANFEQILFDSSTSPKYENEISDMINKIQSMTFKEIIVFQKHLLSVLPFYTNENDLSQLYYKSNYTKIWRSLDIAACNHLDNIAQLNQSVYEILSISSQWFELGLAKDVNYNKKLVQYLLTNHKNMEKVILIYLMFALNMRRHIDILHVNPVISNVTSYLSEDGFKLTLDELSIIAMGFFKTQTKMPISLLEQFVRLCTKEFSKNNSEQCNTISVTSILKLIRYSLESTEFDARILRPEIQTLVEAICDHKANLLDSNICNTHLIQLLNSSFMQNMKRLYKTIFDRMISNLNGFRIKDIERILFCLANAHFKCPNYKLKLLEDHLMKSDERLIYPYHVYNITYFLLTLNFFPNNMIKLCTDKEFLKKSIDLYKLKLNDTLLITDTILRVETTNPTILSDDQIEQYCQLVIVTLMTKDKTYGDSIRGFALINKRLLEKLGFRVLLLKQRDYPQFIMPTDKVKPDSEEYREETNKLLNTIKVVL
ncbi:hypothetical protein RDWZM_005333 [Blomia tropicalis]|uniref:Uncharacterized protein n=1 Tax=Blomia tropicalis TaxID=40697 RepID=A0A9Q0RND1_BLOTA|nr:hypothetical protein RDWZM_005333 [Blomia tropicalis]